MQARLANSPSDEFAEGILAARPPLPLPSPQEDEAAPGRPQGKAFDWTVCRILGAWNMTSPRLACKAFPPYWYSLVLLRTEEWTTASISSTALDAIHQEPLLIQLPTPIRATLRRSAFSTATFYQLEQRFAIPADEGTYSYLQALWEILRGSPSVLSQWPYLTSTNTLAS